MTVTIEGTEETARLIKGLVHKPKNLSLVSNADLRCQVCDTSPREIETGGLLELGS